MLRNTALRLEDRVEEVLSISYSLPKPNPESVEYTTQKTEVVYKLNSEMMKALEKKFPAPVISSTTSPLEAAAHAARQHVFKELRDGFVTG